MACKGVGMNKEDIRRQIIKRLKLTGQNETICLMDWEVAELLEYIHELEKKARERECRN